jgi:hypothetical protein
VTDLALLSLENRGMFQLAMIVGALLLVQIALVMWAVRRLDELTGIRERLSRLADGLALLTDTTEAGLSTIARELQQQAGRASGAQASRATVGRRVVAAAQKGETLSTIAGHEALSESEVRLHLTLAGDHTDEVGVDAAPGHRVTEASWRAASTSR